MCFRTSCVGRVAAACTLLLSTASTVIVSTDSTEQSDKHKAQQSFGARLKELGETLCKQSDDCRGIGVAPSCVWRAVAEFTGIGEAMLTLGAVCRNSRQSLTELSEWLSDCVSQETGSDLRMKPRHFEAGSGSPLSARSFVMCALFKANARASAARCQSLFASNDAAKREMLNEDIRAVLSLPKANGRGLPFSVRIDNDDFRCDFTNSIGCFIFTLTADTCLVNWPFDDTGMFHSRIGDVLTVFWNAPEKKVSIWKNGRFMIWLRTDDWSNDCWWRRKPRNAELANCIFAGKALVRGQKVETPRLCGGIWRLSEWSRCFVVYFALLYVVVIVILPYILLPKA